MPIYTKVDSYTKLLIHSLSTNNNANFYDYSPSQHTVTTSSDPVHSTTQKQLGPTSMHFDGNDYLEIADHADLDLDGGDFTVDLWFRCDDVDSPSLQSVLAKWQVDSNNSYYCLIHPTASLRWYVGNGGSGYSYVGGSTIADDTWYHAALTKVGDVFTSYINGVQDGGTTTYAAFADNNLPVTIGSAYGGVRPFAGYIDEVRISKGIARWTSNFTPPTRPYGVVDSELNASLSRLNTTLTATNSGRIGIGTTGPDNKLEIQDDATWNVMKITSGHTVGSGFTMETSSGGSDWSIISNAGGGGAGAGNLGFHLTDALSGSNGYKMTLTDGGVVAIGTTAEGTNAKLNVAGGINFVHSPASAAGLNVVAQFSFNNSNTSNACGSVYYKCFYINFYHNNGHSQCLFLANGGGGVGYNFTGIVPGNTSLVTGTGINTSFTTIGSSPNTFQVQISSGGGALTVSRTSGTGSFQISVQVMTGG